MISIKRVECPKILKTGQTPESKGETETRRNIERGSRSYKVYSDKAVRKTLEEMLHGKCAYCESRITVIYSGDIEHFRPKGGGYYWLAADWENLLFACPFCNQTHTHVFSTDGTIKEAVQGKLDQFPLLSEDYRLNAHHGMLFFSDELSYKRAFDLEESVRLLIKPCTDANIEMYFKYDEQGVILAGDRLDGVARKKAETSIRVYALQRLGLVLEREAKVIQIKAQIKRVENAINDFNIYFERSQEERIWFEGILRAEMKILQRFQDDDQEYAGLARYIIGEYFNNFS